MIGELATSKAGHDKDRLYMIVGEEGECVYLCDGRLRGVEPVSYTHLTLPTIA